MERASFSQMPLVITVCVWIPTQEKIVMTVGHGPDLINISIQFFKCILLLGIVQDMYYADIMPYSIIKYLVYRHKFLLKAPHCF